MLQAKHESGGVHEESERAKPAQIAEIEAALVRAEEMMGENIGKIIPPP